MPWIPTIPDIWYAGTPAGGIWKSTNAGDSWTNLFDDFLQIGVSSIAIDPNNTDIIYIATGDDDASDSYSIGVYKSLDGGQSWTGTGLSIENTVDFPNWGNNRLLSNLIIDPTNSDIVWAAGSFGVWKSEDAGDTWSLKLNANVGDLKMKPGDPNTLYTASAAFRAGNFYRTTDGDTFTEIQDILPESSSRIILAVSPDNPEAVYVLSAADGGDREFQGFYKSTDSGLTFEESPNTENIMESNQAWFDLALAVDPTDEDKIYMGCLNFWASLNSGDSWSKRNEWFILNDAYTHADIHTIEIVDGKIFACTDGGLYVSEDGGATFTDKTSNMAITQFYRMSIGKNDISRIVGGTQDNAGIVLNEGAWANYTSGDGMDYEVDPNNSDLIFGFVQFGSTLFISTNGGQSAGGIGTGQSGNWITPLAIGSDGEVYAGYDSAVYRLDGNSLVKWSNDFGSGNIDDIEVDPSNPDIIYAAEADFLFRSEDGGENFTTFNRFPGLISDIAIDQDDGSTVYVTTSLRVGSNQSSQGNAGQRGVFKVNVNPDGSAGPEIDITGNLDTDQAFFSIIHQGRHSLNPIYVGTNLGVFRLDDSLTEWEDYFSGLPSTAYSDLEISLDEELIVASTYGRGIWSSPIPVEIFENDLRLVSISPSEGSILCGEIAPSITVENNGQNTITEINVIYNVNSGGDESIIWTGVLNPDATTVIELPLLNGLDAGELTLNVNATLTGDEFPENNSGSIELFSSNLGFGDQLFDFETGNPTLLTFNEDGGNPLWEQGVPSGTVLNQVSSGTQAFATNLDGNHPADTKAYLLTGCYELSSIVAPVLRFQMAYDLEINFDIFYVEYSTDDGNSWDLLGQLGSQPNWYNSDRTNASSGSANDCQNCPGGQWTGTNATMTEYAYDFAANAALGETDLTGESNIIFRLVFQSDPGVEQEGVVIDDFVVSGVQDDEDDDNDGVLDVDDNCPLQANADQADNDNDGIGDVCDPDDDNDGILDIDDICPLISNADQADFDGDGLGDVCDPDIDNDGVPNTIDQCNDTPAGATVDVDGCEVFSLPASNFTLQSFGESCIGSDNGRVVVTAANTGLNYSATLSSASAADVVQAFTETTEFTNLVAGDYSLCITVEGQASYQQCYNLTLTEPEPLSVSAKVNTLSAKITLDLQGGTVYYINLNGTNYQTSENQITLDLDKTENFIKVTTDKDCQGSFDKTVILEDDILAYPNPIGNEDLTLYVGQLSSDNVRVSLYNVTGAQLYSKTYVPEAGTIRMNISNFPGGVYLLNISNQQSLKTFKILKR